MTIGINVVAALKQPRTGVEEYAYQLIKNLTMLPEARAHRFFLYVPKAPDAAKKYFDFPITDNFEVRELKWSLPMWTQIGLACEMWKNKPDVLFIPVHILPRLHPKNSVVTIHGLEYEYFPEYYPVWFRNYLRLGTKYAVKHSRKIIAVSENTKNDLVKLYGAEPEKIEVVHHGISSCHSRESLLVGQSGRVKPEITTDKKPYLLYVGRIELKKNIQGILDAYKILKETYDIPHELVLAGAPGFGYEKIKLALTEACPPLGLRRTGLSSIRELGYVSDEEKWQLLSGADVFLFPTFYEGFGIPILEAQTAGVPVVSSNTSSILEVAGDSAMLIDPKRPDQIVEAVHKIIDDKTTRDKLIGSGFENVKKFSWEKCARETLKVLVEN